MNLRFLHRRTPSHEIYFVVNDGVEAGVATCTFRDAGQGVPTRWEPLEGTTSLVDQPTRDEQSGRVTAPLFMAPHDACFIVFER
jgi:hypothetical protein